MKLFDPDYAVSRILWKGIGIALVCLILIFIFAGKAMADGPSVGISCSARWTATAGATGYRVYVGSTATNKTQRAQVTTTSVQCSDLNLSAGQQYIHVTAFNVAGESVASNTLPFVLVTVPAAPVGLELVLE